MDVEHPEMKRTVIQKRPGASPTNIDAASDTANPSTKWPADDLFMLRNLDDFKHVRNPAGEWLGVYGGFSLGFAQGLPVHEVLCTSRSPVVLYRNLKRMAVAFPVLVRRAASKSDLPRQPQPSAPDPRAQQRRKAFEALYTHRRLMNPNGAGHPMVRIKGYNWFVYELLQAALIDQPEAASLAEGLRKLCVELLKIEERATDWTPMRPLDYSKLSQQFAEAASSARQEKAFRVSSAKAQLKIDKFLEDSEKCVRDNFRTMRQAAEFLRELGNEAKRKGFPAGDRSTAKQTRRAIEIFRGLASGKSVKEIAVDEAGEDYERRLRSLSVTIRRFEKRVAKAVYDRFGPKVPSLNYLYLVHALDNWPEIDRRRDRDALLEAARRALPNVKFPPRNDAA